jgi:hypothetical protein
MGWLNHGESDNVVVRLSGLCVQLGSSFGVN